ncbi:MAG: Ycf66 family protein [Nostocaceae cyanobacterium]|nr:Ycf66 family protein [Nostocaceae cyanobacterium]
MVHFGLNSASILAQVNFGTNSASILGIFLAVAGAALYFLRSVRPELSRDQDIFFAAVGLLCGFILIFQGWRLDPILQFGQLLLVGSTVFFAVESIRLRGIATEQAKRNTKIVDDERPVSNRYKYEDRYEYDVQAELEELEPYEEPAPRRRIRGSTETRSSRDDYYEDEAPQSSDRRTTRDRDRSSSDRYSTGEKPKRRSSSRPPSRSAERTNDDEWDSSPKQVDDWDSSNREDRRPRRPSSNGSSRPEMNDEDVTPPPRKKRRRPSTESTPRPQPQDDDDVISTDYVEYKPINKSTDDESDNSTNFDDDI